MPRLDPASIPVKVGSSYPAPYDKACVDRKAERLSEAGGLTQFGAHRVTLAPGAWSSQRHWHSHEDELVLIVEGYPTFIDETERIRLRPGDVTTHKGGEPNGHHMINETDSDVVYLVVGTRAPERDSGHYPDIDLDIPANGTADRIYQRKDGRLY